MIFDIYIFPINMFNMHFHQMHFKTVLQGDSPCKINNTVLVKGNLRLRKPGVYPSKSIGWNVIDKVPLQEKTGK